MIQVAATLEETLELPGWFDKVSFAALLLGFPIALLLSWAYEIRPDSSSSATRPAKGKTAFTAILVALIAAGLAYSYYLFDGATSKESSLSLTPTIAVLPFADLSPESDQTWFADGISEEILNVLAKTEGLNVASRTASFRYRGSDVDLKSVAKDLQVATILEGSVRSQGDQLRITAQLINAADGFHLWSGTFDRQRGDIFAVQDEISVNIATALFGKLGIEALPEHRFEKTRDVEAYNAYLRGMDKLNGANFDERATAVTDFETATSLDPGFVAAWVGLARSETILGLTQSRKPTIGPALIRALSLDPNNADAVAELAFINVVTLRYLDGEQLYLRAITLDNDNDNARIHRSFGQFLRRTGRVRRALEEFLQARALGSDYDDLGSLIVNTHAYLGRFAEARNAYEAELEKVGLAAMRGNEAYFVSFLADGMEAEARAFADRELPGATAPTRIRFFLERLDGNPEAADRRVATPLERIENNGFTLGSDLENLIMAGELKLARLHAANSISRIVGAPDRVTLYIDDEIDPRYLPYRANLLLILDEFPDLPEAFMSIGIDLVALAREKGYLE